MYVDGWKIKNVRNVETGLDENSETFEGPENIENAESEKYLGDIISHDGSNTKNIQNRQNKGHGAYTQIIQILESIYFGKYYFQAAVTLRNSLLISSMLFNSEAWYNVTTVELEKLEKIDEKCLRKILNAPFATPKVMLYLELGVIPIRYIIKSRRLNYLYYILHEDEQSLINQFLHIQLKEPTTKDWGSQVKKDINELDLGVDIEDIKQMPKASFKTLVKTKIKEHALKYLEYKKKSKTKKVIHIELKMQEYLEPNSDEISLTEKQFLFKCRSRMLDVKENMKKFHKDLTCSACGKEEETQMHLMQCNVLNKTKHEKAHEVNYMDIFCTDLHKLKAMANVLESRLNILHDEYQTKYVSKTKQTKKKQKNMKPRPLKTKTKNK